MMDTKYRPSMVGRTRSTPLSVRTSSTSIKGTPTPPVIPGLNMLTPPSSPKHSRSSSNLSNLNDDEFIIHSTDQMQKKKKFYSSAVNPPLAKQTADGVLICPYFVEVLRDDRDRDETFGHGAWSTVFKASCNVKHASGLATPPLSPTGKAPLVVAVKRPARNDAKKIIESEAKVLSYLMLKDADENFVVPFYGILSSDSSLVLKAVPLSLEEHIKQKAISAKASYNTGNMFEPVIGNTATWLDLAYELVSALTWLHEKAMVVHGDIKPGNVLLDRVACDEDSHLDENKYRFPYRPIFADFSSAQLLNSEPTPNTLSALTKEYTAPELLSSKVLSDPKSTATPSSDVFSLAVTLLAAATGNTSVYSGSVYQRQAMATQGWMVIQAVRNGPVQEGARVPKQGVVERALDKAVLRAGMGRIDAGTWKLKLEETRRGEPSKL